MSALARYKAKAAPVEVDTALDPESGNVIEVDGQRWTTKELKTLVKAGAIQIGRTYKNDPASTVPSAQVLQGVNAANSAQYGLFSAPGVRPERFSALQRPLTFMRLLTDAGALTRNEYFNEKLEIMTGQLAATGTNATSFCGNPPQPNDLKVMQRLFNYGKLYEKTNLNSVPQTGFLRDRADVPGRILNAGPTANPLIPDILYQLTDTRSQLQTEFFKLGVSIERSLEIVGIRGNAALASTATQVGWIQEFNGLDSQIMTGYTDVVTGQAAPAADSIVENWGSALVSGTQASTGRNIVQVFADVYYALVQRAARVGMAGFDLVIVCRQEFFRALTDVYACSYNTARCTNGAVGTPQTIDQSVINDLRLEMLQGQYLLIEGVKVPVVFSDGMALTQVAATQFSNSVYFVPINWAGRPLTRVEYFPMDNQYASEFGGFLNADRYRVLNNGLYLVGYRSTGLCDEYHFASQMRLILETPFLAGRIDNIQFTYQAQTRSAYPAETYLYQDGGVTYRYPYYSNQ